MRSIPTAARSIDVIVRDLKTNCERDFGDARAMPPGVYTSPEFLEREQQTLFRNEWLCMGRASALPNPGDYLTAEIAGQPIIVIRRDDGTLRAMSNVCLHRMSTLLEGRGNVRRIVCPYHAWNYSLDGDLRAAPMMDRQDGFCKDSYKLPQVRCEIWQGWVYVTLNEEASPVAARLKELDELIVNYDMASYVETFHEEHVWDTNWKILAENFMESYHLPMLHRATVGPHSRLDEMECPPGLPAFNYHWITKEASLPIGNAHPDNTRLQGQWRKTTALLAIYPTHLVTLTPGYFWYLVLQPLGVDRVHIRFGGGLSPEFIDDPKAAEYMATLKKLLDEVNLEDRRGVEAVFRGVHAPLAKPGHLSHLERPNYDFARYLASHVAV
ncbi:SRPBCC family protein [Burkholderia cenocepacia]|uniref:(2Fe-2S)-binding protein n=1 Tax=Burkholderia cenocepacia TaxID=95486 RepID=A0AAD0J2R4_9BURK|nr:Rieske 2Fe-2S domain-containing protein [Burkholderia cenocepacia]EAY67133.1 2,4-D oxygenase large subunit [Burkholderia cenocepacia PC184]AWG30252.1 (2Fe-2S)-binding protein [Burkholderia cenocepacia]MBR8308571.1 Rieske 2Fe-2S domain-containing protein [Burkholderia cenocepacia]MCA7964375.1 Rieske 2Fe-2S domain-containing protein [Burkholderia cenocepacia]MDR8029274.1 Rieske 2Fe-2S domain-containing protein [Burkholderia cenocepacia]